MSSSIAYKSNTRRNGLGRANRENPGSGIPQPRTVETAPRSPCLATAGSQRCLLRGDEARLGRLCGHRKEAAYRRPSPMRPAIRHRASPAHPASQRPGIAEAVRSGERNFGDGIRRGSLNKCRRRPFCARCTFRVMQQWSPYSSEPGASFSSSSNRDDCTLIF